MKFSATATILATILALPACDGGDKTTSDEGSTSDAATSDASATDPTTTDTPTTTDDTTTASGPLSFATDVWGPILDPICSCHHVAGSGSLVMGDDAATALAAMLGVKAGGAPTVNFVTAGDSTASYIINKLEGTQAEAGGGGSKMPLSGSVTPEQIATIKQWIDDGANP
ncbi:hypothetical protein [Nannocystis sp.]|uniref:hypothetical protein n=1 Tax=Nannocystis sp. TaxID=1962667 RepID=UPI0025E92F9A|nr:hypothetical protein [Nannocystis sp.]MBK7827266.1 hypothetical protein [Nannocystis sp.]